MAVPVLGESLGPATFGGVVLTVAGVAMVAISCACLFIAKPVREKA